MDTMDGNFDAAEALGEVVDAAQMYVTESDAQTLAIIPERCLPYPIISAEDVEDYAHELRKECLQRRSTGAQVPQELEEMREFFARAAKVVYLMRLKLEDFDPEATVPVAIRPPDLSAQCHRI